MVVEEMWMQMSIGNDNKIYMHFPAYLFYIYHELYKKK